MARALSAFSFNHLQPLLVARQTLPLVFVALARTRRPVALCEVAYRMFERWRQENFFKYMREEFLLDA